MLLLFILILLFAKYALVIIHTLALTLRSGRDAEYGEARVLLLNLRATRTRGDCNSVKSLPRPLRYHCHGNL